VAHAVRLVQARDLANPILAPDGSGVKVVRLIVIFMECSIGAVSLPLRRQPRQVLTGRVHSANIQGTFSEQSVNIQ
jgi:hypothetical protein